MIPSGMFTKNIDRQPSGIAQPLDEEAADDRAEGGRESDRRAHDRERLAALLRREHRAG